MIINKANIKSVLGITNTTYDNQIDMLIPQLLDSIVDYCNNEFIKYSYISGKIYDNCELVIDDTTITLNTTLTLKVGDFIRLRGTNYNDGMYQIKTIESGVITIETSKTMTDETINAYIVLCYIPNIFVNVLAQYIKNSVVNDNGNVKKEQIDDTSIEFFAPYDTSNFVASNKYILNNYKKVYRDCIFDEVE